MGAEHKPSAPSAKHVPAQLQPAPGEQLPPFVQSSAAPHVGPVKQLSCEHTHAPSALQGCPPQSELSGTSQSPSKLRLKHLAGSHEHEPSAGLQVPPLRQSLRWSHSKPDAHASEQAQSPLAVHLPFPAPSQGAGSYVAQLPRGSAPRQQALQAHAVVSQSQSPFPEQLRSALLVGQE
jgi:hypothetical protein